MYDRLSQIFRTRSTLVVSDSDCPGGAIMLDDHWVIHRMSAVR